MIDVKCKKGLTLAMQWREIPDPTECYENKCKGCEHLESAAECPKCGKFTALPENTMSELGVVYGCSECGWCDLDP